jgi:hemolysin activation/secretion protein
MLEKLRRKIDRVACVERKFSILVFIFIFFINFGFSENLPVPSSGLTDKIIEDQYEEHVPKPEGMPDIEVDIPERKLELDDTETVRIDKIKFRGNTIIKTKELEKTAKSYINRNLSMKQIYELCRKVQVQYAKQGYFLVRVYPPVQDITDKVLIIEVMEGVLGKVTIEGNQYYSTNFIKRYLDKFIGGPIHYQQLVKVLMLLNENIDLHVESIFKKGESLGTVDLIIKVDDKYPLKLAVDTNNLGSSTTSRVRSSIRSDIGNCFMYGDKFEILGVWGYPFNDLRFVDFHYYMPMNVIGTKIELSYLYNDYRIGKLKELHLKGMSSVMTVKVLQAFIRRRGIITSGQACIEYKINKNYEFGIKTAEDKIRNLILAYDLDFVDKYLGRNIGTVQFTVGLPGLFGGGKNSSRYSSREGARIKYYYFTANYQRIQQVMDSCQIFINFLGQLSVDKLPIPEEFYLGGMYTVRGFPLASAIGDTGFALRFDFRFPTHLFFKEKTVPVYNKKKYWYKLLTLGLFLDHGEVYVKGGDIEGQKNQVFMTSIGLGAHLYDFYNINADVEWGFPLSNLLRECGFPDNVASTISSHSIFYIKVGLKIR